MFDSVVVLLFICLLQLLFTRSLSCYFHFIWGDRHYRPYLRCIFNGILPILKAPVLQSFTYLLPDSNHSNLVVMTEKRAVQLLIAISYCLKYFAVLSFSYIALDYLKFLQQVANHHTSLQFPSQFLQTIQTLCSQSMKLF